jgi:hypothetical protein
LISLKSITESKARKWIWIGLASLVAIQIYYVREMLAALVIFTVVFALMAAVAVVLFLLDRASQRTVAWVEPQAKQAAVLAHRAWSAAEPMAAEINRKLHHRPHSQTVR